MDMYDYHQYDNYGDTFYDKRTILSTPTFVNGPPIFISEYAVRNGNGDLRGITAADRCSPCRKGIRTYGQGILRCR